MNPIIKKQFESKLKQIKASKERRTPDGAIKRFMYAVDKARASAASSIDFCLTLEQESRLLKQTIEGIDPNSTVNCLWVNQEQTEDARELQLEAVHVVWSDEYAAKQQIEKELYVSYISLAFEDIF